MPNRSNSTKAAKKEATKLQYSRGCDAYMTMQGAGAQSHRAIGPSMQELAPLKTGSERNQAANSQVMNKDLMTWTQPSGKNSATESVGSLSRSRGRP